MIIAVDFDGTIHDGQWPGIGRPLPDAREEINALRAEGHYIIIWTCREGRQQTEMVNWLLEQDIHFDRVNDHRPDQVTAYGTDARKVYGRREIIPGPAHDYGDAQAAFSKPMASR